MNFEKTAPDLDQFGSIISGIVRNCSSLEQIGISPEAFKADARNVIATHVNNICADRLNTEGGAGEPAPEGPDAS